MEIYVQLLLNGFGFGSSVAVPTNASVTTISCTERLMEIPWIIKSLTPVSFPFSAHSTIRLSFFNLSSNDPVCLLFTILWTALCEILTPEIHAEIISSLAQYNHFTGSPTYST